MNSLAELVVSFFNLAEAEGRLLRESALSFTRQCVILLIGLLFGAAGLAFLVAALYAFLEQYLPAYGALVILAFVCGIICFGMLWSARNRKPKTLPQKN